jgi:hypothetical protein
MQSVEESKGKGQRPNRKVGQREIVMKGEGDHSSRNRRVAIYRHEEAVHRDKEIFQAQDTKIIDWIFYPSSHSSIAPRSHRARSQSKDEDWAPRRNGVCHSKF